jgi:hypothetical protein
MPHNHKAGWAPKEIGLFVDSILAGGVSLPRIGEMKTAAGHATAVFTSKAPVAKGELHYTSDSSAWKEREWHSVEASLDHGTVSAPLPDERPLVYYLSITDDRGALVSTPHVEEPAL